MKNNTMKNSASNSSTIQAQTQQLLPIITQALSVLQYSEIAHQRIGQQSTGQTKIGKAHSIENNRYEGLTRAKHSQFGSVMIKWQLDSHNSYFLSGLNHEVNVLISLNDLLLNQTNSTAIAPSVLAYHNLDIQVLGQSQQLTVLVMCYYASGNLAKQLRHQNHSLLTDTQKHHFINQTAHLIAELHHAGWLHNDIKPNNILLDRRLTDEGQNRSRMPDLLITDFALAERVDARVESKLAGTPAYLAPERWQGEGATVQSDVYAFGIMMVEILTGRRPFKINPQSSDPMIDWATQHCQHPIPRLPTEYSHYQCIVDGALAKRIEKRYQTMDKVILDLEEL